MTQGNPAIAIVDDETKMRQALGRLLRLHDFEVVTFESGDEFLRAPEGAEVDCVLLDLHFPGETDGFGVLEALRQRDQRPPVILITAHDQPGNDERARSLGASDYLLKPVDETPLIGAIRRATGETGHCAELFG
ncbi:MAG: response regulator [Verrucomicrobiae bacterium]|nr:response regulator [Verrucomicrobiae bacterium]